MTAVHGSAARLFANGRAIHRALRELAVNASRDVHDRTTFGETAHRFAPGLKEAQLTGGGFVETEGPAGDGVASIDELLNAALGGSEQVLTYLPAGDGMGNRAVGVLGNYSEYEVGTPADDLASVGFAVQSNVGRESLRVLHPEGTGTGNGLGLDGSAASSRGGVGILHVTAIDAAATLNASVQHSADDVTYVDLVTFDEASAIGAQRVEVEGTVERYVRATSAAAGGNATHHVAFGRR